MTTTVGVWIRLYTEMIGEDREQAEKIGLTFAQEIKAKCLERGSSEIEFHSDVDIVSLSDDGEGDNEE